MPQYLRVIQGSVPLIPPLYSLFGTTLPSLLPGLSIARAGSQRVNRAVDGDVVAIELVAGPPSAAEQALDAVLTAQQLALQVQYISLICTWSPSCIVITQHECCGDYCAVLVPRVRT
jgi:hypothetical protein